MTDLKQAAQQALDFVQRVTAWEGGSSAISGLPDRHGTLTALRTALEQQAEPGTREGFERWAKSLPNYIDLSRFEDGYSDCNTDYAWAGWQAAQRPWVGLTDEDVRQCSQDVVAGGTENSVDRFAYAIEAKLKERNT